MTPKSDTFSERLRQLIGENSVSSFGKKCGIGESTLRQYLKGGMPGLDKLVAIAETGNVNIEWLATGDGPMRLGEKVKEDSTTSEDDYFTSIPLVNVQLSAGNGSFVISEEIKEYYKFRKDWLSKTVTSSPNAILVGVTGNSMEPTIYNGDVVMIDTGRTHIYEGEMYALRMDNTVMVKRLSHRPGDKVMIMSDNKEEYPPYETDRKNIHVLAQVVWYARTLVKTDAYK